MSIPGIRTASISLAALALALGLGNTAAAQTTAAKAPAKAPAKPAPRKALPPPTTAAQRAALPAADDAQTAAAEQVLYGKYVCDQKFEVFVEKNTKSPGYVDVRYQKDAWVMKPVASNSGAIRLEDTKGAVLLVQIPSKSMLLNTRTGQRIVDSCQSPGQEEAAREAAREPASAAPTEAKQ